MKVIALSLISAIGLGAAASSPPRATLDAAPLASHYGPESRSAVPAASWAPRDSADSLWRRGRIAISQEDWSFAGRAFAELQEKYPNSTYAGDALYWRAFALQRVGGGNDIRRAVAALELQKAKYPKSATFESGESSALMTRLNGRLARSGDAAAAAVISEMATAAAMASVEAVASVMPIVAAELERARPEIARGLAEARSEMARSHSVTAERYAALTRTSGALPRVSARFGSTDDIPAECVGVIGEERIEALNALLQMSSDQALPILKRVLERRDKCSEVLRRKAVFLVSQKHTEEAVDILLNTAKTDPDIETRKQAVFWLSETNSERAVEVLEQILVKDSPDAELQEQALFAISQNRSERANSVLRDYARRRDVSAEQREQAIFWLGQRRGSTNVALLKEMFATVETDELREKVLFSIAQNRTEGNSQWLLARAKDRKLNGELRKSALFWAGQSGADIKAVAEIYDTADNDRELRKQVIFVLSQRRNDTAAMDKLVDIAQREPDKELRQQAIFWLGQSRDPRAAKLLEDIINKPM